MTSEVGIAAVQHVFEGVERAIVNRVNEEPITTDNCIHVLDDVWTTIYDFFMDGNPGFAAIEVVDDNDKE